MGGSGPETAGIRRRVLRPLAAAGGAAAAVLLALLAAAVRSAPVEETEVRGTAIAETAAAAWGLAETEWTRYEALMSGPRGAWSPGADPLLVLGAHARDAAERRRFAEAYVRAEQRRTAGELAFERAVGEAWARLHGDTAMFASAPAGAADSAGRSGAVRFAVAVDADCATCRGLVESFWNGGRPVDFHVVGTGGRDAALRAWVAGLDVDVSRPGVTVNHGGRFEGEAVPRVLGQLPDGTWRELRRDGGQR